MIRTTQKKLMVAVRRGKEPAESDGHTRHLKLKPCPPVGEGVHKWIYYAACTLLEANYSNEDLSKVEAAVARYEVREVGRSL
jgi:hypothetical protein